MRHKHDPSKTLVGFVVGDVTYAVRIDSVREITNPLNVIALPRSLAHIIGVSDYRGEIVPVVDLRVRFDLPPAPREQRSKWIIVSVGAHLAALVVDTVTEVFGTMGADLKAAPSLGKGDEIRGIMGATTHDGKLVFVLDTTSFKDITELALARASIPPQLDGGRS